MASGLRLSPRQKQVLQLLLTGKKLEAIGQELSPRISLNTVKKHVHKLYPKLSDAQRTEIWRARYWAR